MKNVTNLYLYIITNTYILRTDHIFRAKLCYGPTNAPPSYQRLIKQITSVLYFFSFYFFLHNFIMMWNNLASIWYNRSHFSLLISKSQRQLVLLLLPFSDPVFQQLTNLLTFCYILFMWRSRNKRNWTELNWTELNCLWF